jgi:AraC-like DNA-binding protein
VGQSASMPRFGGGPNKLRVDKRLEIAKERLLAGWTLVSVAKHVGYTTAAAFSDAFLSLVGERPGAWKARTRAEQNGAAA